MLQCNINHARWKSFCVLWERGKATGEHSILLGNSMGPSVAAVVVAAGRGVRAGYAHRLSERIPERKTHGETCMLDIGA